MCRERIRRCLLTATLTAALALSAGCELIKTRVVMIPPGEPVQLAEPVSAHIYVQVEGRREKSENRVTLPEGWWVLPDPGPE